MELTQLRKPTDWFKVHAIRQIDDPTDQIDRKEIVVSLDQYPHGFGLGPNPRLPDLSSRVSKSIEETLRDAGKDFHLLNRGITIIAKGLEYDNKTEKVRLRLHETNEEEPYYGILDGGNTNARITKWREELPDDGAAEELASRYVNVQVLIPKDKNLDLTVASSQLVDLLNDIKQARNTSVQVKAKSLADARRDFELLKGVLSKEPYFEEIYWREGEKGKIDGLQILMLLMIFFPSFSASSPSGEPSNAYGHKDRCLDAFLEFSESEADREALEKWIGIVPDLVRLFDKIQLTLPEHYSGHFGKITEVQIFDERRYERGNKKYRKTPSTTYFLGQEMKYTYPTGWLFPVFAGFRVLAALDLKQGSVIWKRDPLKFWETYSETIVQRYEPYLKNLNYEVKRVATDPIVYQGMRTTVTDLYKDELLREAGIAV
jgi:hypothetical protein